MAIYRAKVAEVVKLKAFEGYFGWKQRICGWECGQDSKPVWNLDLIPWTLMSLQSFDVNTVIIHEKDLTEKKVQDSLRGRLEVVCELGIYDSGLTCQDKPYKGD